MLLNLTVDRLDFETYWCRVYQSPQAMNTSPHNHSFFEIHYCLDGEGILDVKGVSYNLNRNSFIITPPYCQHTCVRQSNDFKKFVWGVRIRAEDKAAYEALDRLCELCICSGAVAASEVMLSFVDNIERCLSGNYANHVDVVKVMLAGSRRQFTRIFQTCTGVSPANYYKKLRLIKAEKLLLDTDMTLEEISSKVGYGDGFTFSKAFKAYCGVSPKEFRESIKAN